MATLTVVADRWAWREALRRVRVVVGEGGGWKGREEMLSETYRGRVSHYYYRPIFDQ